MKKLMIAAAVTALAGATFAANVYDYKASVKYVDFKKVTVAKAQWNVKTVKSTTLNGYLVTPISCGCTVDLTYAGYDPAFLIVENKKSSGAEKYTGVKNPKVLPANLLSKVWATSASSKTLEAQGYLFAGVMDQTSANFVATPSTAYDFGDNTTIESQYLWSIWNDTDPNTGVFVETWLTHAGFGKATTDIKKDAGCKKGSSRACLVSLAGSVVGGAFTCEPSESRDPLTGLLVMAIDEEFLCQGWNTTTGDQILLMDVVSGTWSIKANTKITAVALNALVDDPNGVGFPVNTLNVQTAAEATEELGLLKAAGQKLMKGYNLGLVDPLFVAKWF